MSLTILIYLAVCFQFVQQLPLNAFFPFGSSVNDQIFPPNDDLSTPAIPLPISFPYFENDHRQIYLANNGLFSFLGPIPTFVPIPFPLSNDTRLIAAFWSDIDTRGNVSQGNMVYYQIYWNTTNTTVFQKATSFVRRYFPAESRFKPTMVITGTWFNVGAYPLQTNFLNTFQIVLATDGTRSFVFLLYHDIQWTDPASAAGGSPGAWVVAGQAGFNAGDGIIFQTLPYSRTTQVNLLVNSSNVNEPGLFIFRVDSAWVASGGCRDFGNFLIRPNRGSQLGHTPINIQGPCSANFSTASVKCLFENSTAVDAIIINNFHAICLSPAVALPSTVNLYLSTDGGNSYQAFAHRFTYTAAEYGISTNEDPQVSIINQTDFVVTSGTSLNLSWFLSEATIQTWANATIQLEVEMCIVTTSQVTGGITLNSSMVLRNNITPIIGTQFTSVVVPSIQGTQSPTVFFRIIAKRQATNIIYIGLHSPLFILRDVSNVSAGQCQAWIASQPPPHIWNGDLPSCPMILSQANVSRCCYEPDPLCRLNASNPHTNCLNKRGRSIFGEESAIACYRSTLTNWYSAATECCYSSSGQLITRGTGAGTDKRAGPTFSSVLHYNEDTLPFISCCLVSPNIHDCDEYFNLRPVRLGSNTKNSNGASWGDPHFMTPDGTAFTFNGYGEYTYLAILNNSTSQNVAFDPMIQNLIFESQIRTTPLPGTGVLGNRTTVICGFAAKSNHSQAQPISVIITGRQQILVKRGNETLDLEGASEDVVSTNEVLKLFFPEMLIERNRNSGTLRFTWFIGVSIEITPFMVTSVEPNILIFGIHTSVSSIHLNRTMGLLGVYDGNSNNDLQSLNGTVVGIASTLNLNQIHYDFGETWLINVNRSLFSYEASDSAIFYNNQARSYVPSFQWPTASPGQLNAILSSCNINSSITNSSQWTIPQQMCYYDTVVTNDSSFGQNTLIFANVLEDIRQAQRNPPIFNSNISLEIRETVGNSITLDFQATSEFTNNIQYSLIHGPAGAILSSTTGRLTWTVTLGNSSIVPITVAAYDSVTGLVSSREVLIRISSISTSTAIYAASSHVCGSLDYAIIGLLTVFMF